MRSSGIFLLLAAAVGAALFFYFRGVDNDYLFFAGYTVLQFIVLATAWNILGGYCGYVNFGSAAFFAIGAYTTVALYYAFQAPLLVTVPAGTAMASVAMAKKTPHSRSVR